MTEANPNENPIPAAGNQSSSTVRRTLAATAVAASFVLVILFLGYTATAWLLFFAAVLLAILLRSISDWLAETTGIRAGASLGLTVVSLLILGGLVGWLLGDKD